jgi:hypothetical protein
MPRPYPRFRFVVMLAMRRACEEQGYLPEIVAWILIGDGVSLTIAISMRVPVV